MEAGNARHHLCSGSTSCLAALSKPVPCHFSDTHLAVADVDERFRCVLAVKHSYSFGTAVKLSAVRGRDPDRLGACVMFVQILDARVALYGSARRNAGAFDPTHLRVEPGAPPRPGTLPVWTRSNYGIAPRAAFSWSNSFSRRSASSRAMP